MLRQSASEVSPGRAGAVDIQKVCVWLSFYGMFTRCSYLIHVMAYSCTSLPVIPQFYWQTRTTVGGALWVWFRPHVEAAK